MTSEKDTKKNIRSKKTSPTGRKAIAITPRDGARKKVNVRPAVLLDAAAKIRKLVRGINKNELPALYEVSKLVRDAEKNGKYGDGAVEILADELGDLGLKSQTLRNYASVSKSFDEKEFGKLTARTGGTTEKPFSLTWSHLIFFAGKTGKTLKVLVDKTFEQSLSEKEIRKTTAAAPQKPRRDLAHEVRGLAGDIQALTGKGSSIDDTLAKIDAVKKLSSTLEAALQATADEFARLETFAKSRSEKCRQLIAKFGLKEHPGEAEPEQVAESTLKVVAQ